MENLTNNITDITIGIRFQRSFRIQDILGAITDKLLYDESSPLDTDYFPKRNQNISEMILLNEKKSYLRVNTDDIVFKHVISKNFDQEFKFIEKYLKYIKKLLGKYNIINITRIGIIYNHEIENDQSKFINAIETITNNDIHDVNDFSFSFSKKLPVIGGVVKKDVNDYKNVVYLFRKISGKNLVLGLDFQKYFDPPLENLEDNLCEKFLNDSKQYLLDTFYTNFLNTYTNEKEK